jgi:short-subunit dehydrogenase
MSLDGKTAVITGASRGIGAALAVAQPANQSPSGSLAASTEKSPSA